MTEPRIRWEEALDGETIGYIGTLPLPAFRIYSPDAAHGNWLLSIRLAPGNEFVYGASMDELKAEAERWLAGFVSSLGAVFFEPADDEKTAATAAREKE